MRCWRWNGMINRLKKLDKRFGLALPLLLLLFYGVWAQYLAYQAGILPAAAPSVAVAVAGFDAVKPENSVVVAVSGAVKNRGYYALPADMELRDFLDFIGLQAESDVSAWDLAHQPQHGDQYYVANVLETEPPDWLLNETYPEPAATKPTERLNINTATLEELQQLPGIGPSRAQAIINYRVEHNGFRYAEELLGVKGIGEKIYEQLQDRIKV